MSLDIQKNDKILVVAPHPDDESIGCGGTLSLYRGHCDVLLVTDGYSEELDNREISQKRKKEFAEAVKFLDVCKIIELHISEGKIEKNADRFLEVDYSCYKYILVPNRFESHKDHRDVYSAVMRAAKRKHSAAELLEYEVWTTLRNPNVKIDITNVTAQKEEAIKKHASQVSDLDYVGMILGLNAYRGKSHGCGSAEVFFSKKRAKIKRSKDRKKYIKGLIKK